MLAVAEPEHLPVEQARGGDAAAWEVLFRRYQLPLYVYVFELVRNEQASLDVVQETFISAARHIGGLREDGKFGSWLFGIAHQKYAQHWRRDRRRETVLDPRAELSDDFAGNSDDPGDWLVRKEQEEQFMSALNQLPEAHRAVVLLHFLEGFPLAEIAAITGAQLGTVKSRLHYAKKTLRKLLEEQP